MTMGVVIERQDHRGGVVSDELELVEPWASGSQPAQPPVSQARTGAWGSFLFGTGGHHNRSSSSRLGNQQETLGDPFTTFFGDNNNNNSPGANQQLPFHHAAPPHLTSATSSQGPQVAPPPLLTLSIVTEYMALGSLSDLLYSVADFQGGPSSAVFTPRRSPLPADSWSHDLLLLCASQAARGMSYLHGRGIAHRDLKCANLVVDEHWRVKVCDYGSSRFVDRKEEKRGEEDPRRFASVADESSSATTAETSDGGGHMTADVGSVRWMAPETFGAGKRVVKYSYPADVYSFGMCLFEMASRAPPWPDLRSRFDVADAVSAGKPLTLDGDDLPPAFLALYALCAHRDPARRPSFAYVVDDLDDQRRALRALDGPSSTSSSGGHPPWLRLSPPPVPAVPPRRRLEDHHA